MVTIGVPGFALPEFKAGGGPAAKGRRGEKASS
jgi:hypothetical protein